MRTIFSARLSGEVLSDDVAVRVVLTEINSNSSTKSYGGDDDKFFQGTVPSKNPSCLNKSESTSLTWDISTENDPIVNVLTVSRGFDT